MTWTFTLVRRIASILRFEMRAPRRKSRPSAALRDESSSSLLDRIEASGPAVIAEGHPAGRIGAELGLLLASDLWLHPWAALVAAAALHDTERGDPRVAQLLRDADKQFAFRRDRRGSGYTSFVRGNIALGFGLLSEAVAAWRCSRELLAGEVPMDEALVGMVGLEAYEAGNLHAAVAFGEEALALSRLHRNPRQEASALVYLTFFTLSLGQCKRADALLRVGEEVTSCLLSKEDRADAPLLQAAAAVLLALRGGHAEGQFALALDEAERLGLPWHEAIVRCLRAEFLPGHPEEALSDARKAFSFLRDFGEQWWTIWAERALATAAVGLGDVTAGITGLRRLLARPLAPQERARTLLSLGEALLRSGEDDGARVALKAADQLHDALGMEYWRARGLWLLARSDPTAATAHIRLALGISDGDAAYGHLAASTSPLLIRLLGRPTITVDGERCRFATHNAEKAVYQLVLAPSHALHAEVLADRLWDDCTPERQAVRIRNLLWQIRRAFGPLHAWRLTYERKVVHLRLDGAKVDLSAWQDAAGLLLGNQVSAGQTDALPAAVTPEAASVVAALREPLLPDWQYEEWVIDQQYSLRQLLALLIDIETQ